MVKNPAGMLEGVKLACCDNNSKFAVANDSEKLQLSFIFFEISQTENISLIFKKL